MKGTLNAERPGHRLKPRVLRLVRRVHMYLGIILMPWLALYGLSGVLFNHPNLFQKLEARRVGPSELGEKTAWRADVAADHVLAALGNAGGDYEIDRTFAPRFVGFAMLSADATDGRHLLFINVEKGAGVHVHRKRPAADTEGPLPPQRLPLPELTMPHWERAAFELLEHEPTALSALKATAQVSPKLLLRAKGADGASYNLVYDTYDGRLSGRKSTAQPAVGTSQWMATMHTTHHFPLSLGPLSFWALFQDLLGMAMVLWAITGAVMWWQIKRTRITGTLALVAAFAIAGWVTVASSDQLFFGDVRAVLGPGE